MSVFCIGYLFTLNSVYTLQMFIHLNVSGFQVSNFEAFYTCSTFSLTTVILMQYGEQIFTFFHQGQSERTIADIPSKPDYLPITISAMERSSS